jgi:hypothetical protein
VNFSFQAAVRLGKYRAKNRIRLRANSPAVIDTVVAMVILLLVLGAAFFQQNQPTAAISRISISKDSTVSSIIRKWTKHSDN